MYSQMYSLSTLSVLEFSGHDASQFLHDQLSADIVGLAPGQSTFACYCNPAGRVLGLLSLSPLEGSIFAICSSGLAGSLLELFSKYIIRADVRITLRDDLTVVVTIQTGEIDPLVIMKTATGLDYAITSATTEAVQADSQQAQDWKMKELGKGIAWLDEASSAKFLPQMLGYEQIGALSFTKGCFPGQEIIARTRYLGKLKRRPLLLHIDENISFEVNEKITLIENDETCSAIVVDRAKGVAQDQLLFVVVRAAEEIKPNLLRAGDREIKVSHFSATI